MRNFKILLIISSLILTLSACFEAPVSPVDEELTALNDYIKKNYPDVEPTKSGLYFIPQKTGFGDLPKTGDTLIINYVGKLIDGTEFDNTYTNEKPFEYVVGGDFEIIAGFKEGIMMMREGQTALLIMPSDLAYGDKQNGMIPPYSSLIFEVEINAIIHP